MLGAMDVITIQDLAVLSCIGVPDEERAKPQRLLITIEIKGDFCAACQSDEITQTINYYDVSRRIVEFCQRESFKLIEKLAHEIAVLILRDFRAEAVGIRIKKFILSDARYVSFSLTRSRQDLS
jgi:7,8-dihydroneopterin aldolase/epimerase/oxygenase